MIIRPVHPTDHAEWLRMRLNLWGGVAEEHTHDIDGYYPSWEAHRPERFRPLCYLASPRAHPPTARHSDNCGPQAARRSHR
jgi:hypothetical protein